MISRLLPTPGSFLPSLSRCWRESGSAMEGVYRFPFPIFSALSHTCAASPQPKGSGRASEKVRALQETTCHRQGNSRRRCPTGLPWQPRSRFPPLPALHLLLPAGPTPSNSRAARRWGRSFRPKEVRAPRFSPGLLYPGGRGGRFPRASPPLRSPDAQLSVRAPNFPITLPLLRDWGGWGAAGRRLA